MDDLIDRVLHIAALPLLAPSYFGMRAVDACIGDAYDDALDTAEALAADLVRTRGVEHDDLRRGIEARVA